MKRNNRKKNLRQLRGKWYYRLFRCENNRTKEELIPLITNNKSDAIIRGKVVRDNEEDIKNGVIQKFQYKEYFEWMNEEGTSVLIQNTLKNVIPQYLDYKNATKRKSTANRDRIAINQLCDFIGYSKPIADSDGDGVIDEDDSDPNNPYQCSDLDGDTCDDCSTGTFNPSDDGYDYDGDGQCDAGDCDDDNDGCQECWDYCP